MRVTVWLTEHSEKKRYQDGAPGVLLLQMVPFYHRGTLFSLIIMFIEKRVPLPDRGTIHKNSTPRVTICPISTLFHKSGTILVPFLPEGYCFEAKKVQNSTLLFRGALRPLSFDSWGWRIDRWAQKAAVEKKMAKKCRNFEVPYLCFY